MQASLCIVQREFVYVPQNLPLTVHSQIINWRLVWHAVGKESTLPTLVMEHGDGEVKRLLQKSRSRHGPVMCDEVALSAGEVLRAPETQS